MRPGSLYILVLIFAWTGCSNPSISRFEVKPPVLCDGEKAIVTWDAKGETALAVQEEAPEVGASNCVASGQQILALTLAAHSGSDEVERRAELVELQSNATEPITLRTNAIEATEVVAIGDKNPVLWHKSVEVATISACQNRLITIRHGGKSAIVAPGNEPSDALAGTPLSGTWELQSTLTDAEMKTQAFGQRS
jgi:hypothetical protein